MKCLRAPAIGYRVKDELWAKLPHPWSKHSVLCIECFFSELERGVPYQRVTLNDIEFLAILGDVDNDVFGGTLIEV